MLATEYAEFYSIKAQQEGERNLAFRGRVAGALRNMGKIIEAHEAQQDARYESSDKVMTGFFGALAQALHGDYGSTGESQIGDDIAAGIVVQKPQPEMSPEMALALVALFGK